MVKAVLLMFLLFPALAHGAGPVSLKGAIDLALEKNHLLRSASHQRAVASRDLAMSRSSYLPRIHLEESYAATSNPSGVFMMKMDQGRFAQKDFELVNLNNPSPYHNFFTSLSLEQMIFDLRTVKGVKVAEHQDNGRGHDLEARCQATALQVYEGFSAVRRSASLLAVAEQGLKGAQEHQRLARVRIDSGVGLKADELRAGTYVAEMEQQLISAKSDLQMAKLRLGQVMGVEPGTAVEISGEEDPQLSVPTDDELGSLALDRRSDLKVLKAENSAAAAGMEMAKTAYFPSLYGSAGYSMNGRDYPFGRDNDGWRAGVNLRWELFDGLKRENGLEKAKLQKMAVEEALQHLKKEILLQVKEQTLRRRESEQRLTVARKALQQAEEGLRLVSRRFENSLATMVELLDAETSLNRMRSMVVENESNLQVTTARLLSSAGILLKELGK